MSVYPSGKTVDAAEITEGYRRYPIDDHGKLRFAYGKVTVPAGGLAIGNTMGFMWLPSGRKRIIPTLSRLTCSAGGAARTLSIGHGAYMTNPPGAALEAESANALANAIDISAALNAATLAAVLKYDMYSLDEVLIFGTLAGGTLAAAQTVELLLAYLYE